MKKILVLFTLIFVISYSVNAQLPTNVKVDDLTDVQILQFLKQAESMGYTSEGQLETLAISRGIKANEIVKFKARVEKLKSMGMAVSGDRSSLTVDSGRTYALMTEERTNKANKNENKSKVEPKISKVFGSKLFNNSEITFEPNLRIATPKSYVIGPDDKLVIDLTGDNVSSYNLQVSPEGVINLEYVGRITVAGLSIDQAMSKIKKAMSSTYPGLNTGRTQVAINLGNIRSIQVMITGQIENPGTYTLPSLANVYRALYLSGGPSENGSFRNIQLIRNNKVVTTIDVYDFLLRGIQQGNIRLQDQDVIYVPAYSKRVEINGEVKESAIFELKDKETLQDVIAFAKGFTPDAYTAKIKAFQVTDKEKRIVDIDVSNFQTYHPNNGDKFEVGTILGRYENRVKISGAVFRAGEFSLEASPTVLELIKKAEGTTEEVFLNRAYIHRLNPDHSQYVLSFDLGKLLKGEIADIPLQREDNVVISSIFDLREEYMVTIQGEVRKPNSFQYADNLKLADLIQMAGGLTEGASVEHIEVARRVKSADPNSVKSKIADLFMVSVDKNLQIRDDNFVIKPFDIITIRNSEGYSTQKQVRIEGEVAYPGMYTITSKDFKISDLIQRAGGLTPFAYPDGASLKRPGAEKINPSDKNAIDNSEEENRKFLNLTRMQEKTVKEGVKLKQIDEKLVQSDLVGIDLKKILAKPNSRQNLVLEEGDIIRVPKQLQTVKVTGEILNPNSIVYIPGKTFKQYINGAGGYTNSALKSGAYIKYANGSAEAAKRFLFFNNYPKVKPGAEILVPVKAEKERLNAQSWIGIGTGLASLAAILITVLR